MPFQGSRNTRMQVPLVCATTVLPISEFFIKVFRPHLSYQIAPRIWMSTFLVLKSLSGIKFVHSSFPFIITAPFRYIRWTSPVWIFAYVPARVHKSWLQAVKFVCYRPRSSALSFFIATYLPCSQIDDFLQDIVRYICRCAPAIGNIPAPANSDV